MTEIKQYTSDKMLSGEHRDEIIDFLFEQLGQYGDPWPDIEKAIKYALNDIPSFGGFVMAAYTDKKLSGAAVVNRTGMKDYIPENILVYIATDKAIRGRGIGTQLLREVINSAEGNIALHIDPDNPARTLYERMGFESRYIEMRLTK